MSDFKDLANSLRVKSKAVVVGSNTLVQEVARQVLSSVVMGTPVDVGTASSNWIVKLGEASDAIIEARMPGENRSTEVINKSLTISEGSNTIISRTTEDIVITNNVPYIDDLNSGSSDQAPPRYVQDSILEAIANINSDGFLITTDIPESR